MSTAADASTLETSAPAPAKVGLVSILIPVLISTALTLAAVGGGVFWLLHSGKLGSAAPGAATAQTIAPTVVIAPPASHVLALEPMIVNLSDPGGRSYLRAAVSLRLQDEAKLEKKEEAPKDPKAVDGQAAALRDTTLAVLSSETSDTLLAPASREILKKQLEDEYKLHNPETRVLEIYFTEFLVQRG